MSCSRQIVVALLYFLLLLFALLSLFLDHVFIVNLLLVAHSLASRLVPQLDIEI